MKLNLGCGFDYRDGLINVDSWPNSKADLVFDLESERWPFADSSVQFILAKHVLEHVAPTFSGFQKLWQEIYRVCADQCELEIHLPYYKSHQYWADPSHVRVYTSFTFSMLSKTNNLRWIEEGASNTMLALMLDVNFEIKSTAYILQPEWQKKVDNGDIKSEEITDIEYAQWNVVRDLIFNLVVIKS
jgi:hypothetical protein